VIPLPPTWLAVCGSLATRILSVRGLKHRSQEQRAWNAFLDKMFESPIAVCPAISGAQPGRPLSLVPAAGTGNRECHPPSSAFDEAVLSRQQITESPLRAGFFVGVIYNAFAGLA
jgi:hypothetical protein